MVVVSLAVAGAAGLSRPREGMVLAMEKILVGACMVDRKVRYGAPDAYLRQLRGGT